MAGVHGEVGVAQQLVGPGAGRVEGDADARSDEHLFADDGERPAQGADDALGDRGRAVLVLEVLEEHGELVAAHAGRGVALAQAALQTGGDRHQELVADRVAEAVVHRLEVVEVDEQHGDPRVLTSDASERVLDAITEEHLVRQVRQRVVKRLMGELALEPLRLRDVAEAPHPTDDLAADSLRLRVALDDPTVLELDQVAALGVGLRVQLAHLRREAVGVDELSEHVAQRDAVVTGGEHRLGELPHLGEALVEARDPALEIDDEDAVGGGVERGVEERERRPQLDVDGLAVGDVLGGAGDGDRQTEVVALGDRAAPMEPAHLAAPRTTR